MEVPKVKGWLPPPGSVQGTGSLPRPTSPCPHPEPTRLTMATLSRLPTVRMARDNRSRGCVSTRSEMARSDARPGQHLCGITESSHPAPAPDKEGRMLEALGGGGEPTAQGPRRWGSSFLGAPLC